MRFKVICASLTVAALISAAAVSADDPAPRDQIARFNLVSPTGEVRGQSNAADQGTIPLTSLPAKRPVGSATSTDAGIGVGESVDLTWDDAQWAAGNGRHISHWWNSLYGSEAAVSVHFAYRDLIDSTSANRIYYSGYNVYDAISSGGASWPRGQSVGCDLQSVDTLGSGEIPSLDVMPNGRAVMAAKSSFFRTLPGGSRLNDNQVYYQGSEFQCTYDPRSALNVTWIDSTVYRPRFLAPGNGVYTRVPQVVSQWDGTSTIVHLLLAEDPPGAELNGNDYFSGIPYYSLVYFRKTGETSGGSWSSGQVIDSLWYPWASLAAGPYPQTGVAVTYTNPSYYGALIDGIEEDRDVWCRESFDLGLTWPAAYSVTNYRNALAGDPNHFTAWLETQALYATDGALHVVWTGTPTSNDPYFDGFNWSDFGQDVYHWAKDNGQAVPGTGDIVRVAVGTYEDWDDLCGSINTLHCGFGGSNAGYIANVNISECDDKLYCVWNQIHERANHNNWRCFPVQPMPGVLDDCSYTGNRLAMANWDIFMSVSTIDNSTLWDLPRNVTNTFTAGCGLPGDPLASGPCGCEYKPTVEAYGFDETGLSLNWPTNALVDMTPDALPPYSGGSFLNLQYLDDQLPGPAYWGGNWANPPATENSIKWVRLACVDPIFAPAISVSPIKILWPEWVALGSIRQFPVTVTNIGNLQLNVTEIGFDDNGGGWLGASTTSLSVPAGVDNQRTFNIVVDAGALMTTQWLDGELWLKSDAVNNDSVAISINILAAADVEPVKWDTVTSHQAMFDEFFDPQGECVALAASNNGEIGWRGAGSVNLDYRESELECGTRDVDAVYLKSGSPFVMTALSSSGVGAELTCSYMDASQADPTGWDPSPEKPMSGGATSQYDSVFTGKFVNRDSTIAMERVFYAPRSNSPVTDIINFVACRTMFYSADGQPHNHVTIGNVVDWNVPSDSAAINTAGLPGNLGFVYVQGTDTTGHDGCQSNTGRFATEAFGGGFTKAEWNSDPCAYDPGGFYSINALDQHILADTSHFRNGTDLIPDGPNPEVWWTETSIPGKNVNSARQNQAVWLTYKHDYNLAAADTLVVWTVLTTTRNGTLQDLEHRVGDGKCWYLSTTMSCPVGDDGCCIGRIGDANGSGDDMPTIGDISVMIDAKFISGVCIAEGAGQNIRCLEEADANLSGGLDATCDDITIGDISMLIDCLFITGEPPYVRNECAGNNPCWYRK